MPYGLRCQHLIVMGDPGQPMVTECAVYHSLRYDGMPILLFDRDGRLAGESKCWKGSPKEDEGIIELGIGKGCSLRIEE